MRRFQRFGLFYLLAALGCSSEPVVADGGKPGRDLGETPQDAAPELDSGDPEDAGTPDEAGPAPDSGVGPDLCHPITQASCEPAVQKCIIEPSAPGEGARCVPASPNDVPRGEGCTGEDCLAGLVCVTTSSATPTCARICDINGDGSGCEVDGTDYDCRTRVTGTNWGACRLLGALCNATTQAPCPADRACQPVRRRSGALELRCVLPGTAVDGEPCGTNAGGVGCARALVCIQDPSGGSRCRRICDDNVDCLNMEQCTGSVTEPPLSFCSP